MSSSGPIAALAAQMLDVPTQLLSINTCLCSPPRPFFLLRLFGFIFHKSLLPLMRPSNRRSSLDLVAMRERANRLLRRIAPLVQNYQDHDIDDDAIIAFCSENTFVDCMFPISSFISFSPIPWRVPFPFLVALQWSGIGCPNHSRMFRGIFLVFSRSFLRENL